MSGFVFVVGRCIRCNQVFNFNPHYVPSTSEVTGRREPLCQACFNVLNEKRKQLGLEPNVLHPEAYEPLPESEL